MCEEHLMLLGEPLSPYFTLLTIGFAICIFLAVRKGKEFGIDKDAMIDLGLYAVVWGIIGSRILHVFADGYFWDYVHLCTDPSLVEWKIPQNQCDSIETAVWDAAKKVCSPTETDCFAWAAFWRGGLTYYGGFIGAALFGFWFIKKEKLPMGDVVDVVGSVMAIGLFFGRMGCFLGGCCFGKITDGPFGLKFPPWSPASEAHFKQGLLDGPHLHSLPVHPTQLYEALGCLFLAGILNFIAFPRRQFKGQILLLFMGGYAILRFLLEYVRDDDRGEIFIFSTSQFISIGIIIIVAGFWRWLRPQTKQDSH